MSLSIGIGRDVRQRKGYGARIKEASAWKRALELKKCNGNAGQDLSKGSGGWVGY